MPRRTLKRRLKKMLKKRKRSVRRLRGGASSSSVVVASAPATSFEILSWNLEILLKIFAKFNQRFPVLPEGLTMNILYSKIISGDFVGLSPEEISDIQAKIIEFSKIIESARPDMFCSQEDAAILQPDRSYLPFLQNPKMPFGKSNSEKPLAAVGLCKSHPFGWPGTKLRYDETGHLANVIYINTNNKLLVGGKFGSLDLSSTVDEKGHLIQRCASLYALSSGIIGANIHLGGGRFEDQQVFATLDGWTFKFIQLNEVITKIFPHFFVGDTNTNLPTSLPLDLISDSFYLFNLGKGKEPKDSTNLYRWNAWLYGLSWLVEKHGYALAYDSSIGSTTFFGGTVDWMASRNGVRIVSPVLHKTDSGGYDIVHGLPTEKRLSDHYPISATVIIDNKDAPPNAPIFDFNKYRSTVGDDALLKEIWDYTHAERFKSFRVTSAVALAAEKANIATKKRQYNFDTGFALGTARKRALALAASMGSQSQSFGV